MIKILSWIISAFTIYTMYLAGNKKRSAWIIGLFNQALWIYYILVTGQWGLMLMNIAITLMYIRNLKKWKV